MIPLFHFYQYLPLHSLLLAIVIKLKHNHRLEPYKTSTTVSFNPIPTVGVYNASSKTGVGSPRLGFSALVAVVVQDQAVPVRLVPNDLLEDLAIGALGVYFASYVRAPGHFINQK
jgi:hypothetical protein